MIKNENLNIYDLGLHLTRNQQNAKKVYIAQTKTFVLTIKSISTVSKNVYDRKNMFYWQFLPIHI